MAYHCNQMVLNLRIPSFIEARAATGRGGGKKGRCHPKQKFRTPKLPACPPKLPFSLRQLQDGGFFFGRLQRTRKKVTEVAR